MGDYRVTGVVTCNVSDPGHGLFWCPYLWRQPVDLWILKVAQQTAQVPVSFGPFWLCICPL